VEERVTENGTAGDGARVEIDTSRPHPARMYDYYLGGYDNYEVDREAADRVVADSPGVLVSARANRAFLRRAVRVVAEAGVRQFLDLGTGIPTSPNTHEVAREVVADARVVYVDNDPIVAAHAGARLTSTPGTGFVLRDVRDPKGVLDHPVVRGLIDFDEPVGLMLVAVLHFVADDEDPAALVAEFSRALPAGSRLILSHGTLDFTPGGATGAVRAYARATAALTLRPHGEVLRFFEGFDLLDPGLVQTPLWRPDGTGTEDPAALAGVGVYGGVGVKR
jgi:SAM-dependent methyltransferase